MCLLLLRRLHLSSRLCLLLASSLLQVGCLCCPRPRLSSVHLLVEKTHLSSPLPSSESPCLLQARPQKSSFSQRKFPSGQQHLPSPSSVLVAPPLLLSSTSSHAAPIAAVVCKKMG
ncbi:unnamed protein product [Amoebophrya sp. A25]|nr:unnamed protein product [Amoebophrya sp. A25]|eukprot:GSA25T00017734001.1